MSAGSSAPRPVAQGTVAKTPLVHLLLRVLDDRMSGTLALWQDPPAPDAPPPRGQDRILFRQGRPVAARLLAPAASLAEGLLPLFRRSHAPYAFYETDLVGERPEVVRGDVDLLAVIAAAVRDGAPEGAVERVLAQLGEGPLKFRAPFSLERLRLQPDEQAFVELVQADPASVQHLITTCGDEALARRMLYLLAVTRCLEPARPSDRSARPPQQPETSAAAVSRPSEPSELSEPAEPTSHRRSRNPSGGNERPDTRPQAPPQPPDDLPEPMRERWAEVAERARLIEGQTYYDMLGVERSAGPDAVRSAYMEQVKRWHPDRLPQPLQPLVPWAQVIFHHLTEAKDTLVDDDKRKDYFKAVQQGGGTPEADRKLSAIVGSAMEFQKVEVLARTRAWDEALEVLDAVLETTPEEADYHAMKAWLLFQKHGVRDAGITRQITERVDHALGRNARCERAHYTKGVLLRTLGRQDEALEHFRAVTEINPKHIEAAREVRVAEMRARSKKGAGKGNTADEGGLLSKLFGGKKK